MVTKSSKIKFLILLGVALSSLLFIGCEDEDSEKEKGEPYMQTGIRG